MKKTFTMENQPQLVAPLLNELEETLKSKGVDAEAVHDLRLVSEELLVNTVSYGYDEGQKDQLELCLILEEASLVLELRDRAREFDPLQEPDRDPDDDRIGGWGIPLLKELTDEVRYERQGDLNVITLKKSWAG